MAYQHRSRADLTGACDQLSRAATDASTWLESNPCPDPDANVHMKGQVKACTHLARTITTSAWRSDDVDFMN